MMSTTDTLSSAETLVEAGVPRRQAVAHARVVDAACSAAIADLPTRAVLRADLRALEVRLLLYGVSLAGLLFAALQFG